MNAFLYLANTSGSPTTPTLLRDRAPVQAVIGEAEAIISGAKAYTLDAVGKLWVALCDGKDDPGPEILQGRLAVTHAVRESVRAIDLLYHAAGSHAVRRSNDIERYFRDIHSAVQHIGALPSNYQYGGQNLLGLPPGASGW
jgi:alkylation response protein AidB-like acyl-CoA dehydrogenase